MRAHVEAFLALLRADPVLTDSTHEGVVEDRPERYVTIFDRDIRTVARFNGQQTQVTTEILVHSIGTQPEQAGTLRDHVTRAVLGKVPQPDGWKARRVRLITSQPMSMDRTLTPPLHFAVDVYQFDSEPA